MKRTGRVPLDDVIYKLRFRIQSADGAPSSKTMYYSDPDEARHRARMHSEAGTLLFFGRYQLEKVLHAPPRPKVEQS